MTFDQYINNPMGKGSVANTVAQRDSWKAIYKEKFGQINLREAGRIKYFLYFDEKKDIYVIHALIPSEEVKGFYYDTIVEFTTTSSDATIGGSLDKYDIRFYSNDPSFVFTYMKVFHDNGMLIDWLKSKSPKKAIKEDPKETNPYKIPGYVKSIYFTYLLMKGKGLFLKSTFKIYGSKLNKKKIESDVMHADEKIQLRIDLGKKVAEEKRWEHRENRKKSNRLKEKTLNKTENRLVKAVKKVANTPKTKTTRKVNNVSKVPKK